MTGAGTALRGSISAASSFFSPSKRPDQLYSICIGGPLPVDRAAGE